MNDHYYTSEPSSAIAEKRYIHTLSNGEKLDFTAVSGVFAYEKKLDRASELLIETFACEPDFKGRLLDLGCGYGAIGICLKKRYPKLQLVMSDVNSRAVAYAERNSSINKADAVIVHSDLFEELDGTFERIVTNPPMAMGKVFLRHMLEECCAHMPDNSEFWYTAFHNKGGEWISKQCSEIFGNCETMCKSGGIRVYRSVVRNCQNPQAPI